MSQEVVDENPASPRKPTRWLKRFAWTAAAVLLLLAIFHRPLTFKGSRYFIIRTAKKQNLDLDYKISGTIFSGLHIRDLHVTPTGPGPIEKLDIASISLNYSLVGLLQDGLPGFLRRIEIHDADIAIEAGEKTRKPKGPRKAVKFPALFPAEVNLKNVNFRSHGKGGEFILRNLALTLDPKQPGRLSVEKLAIPGFRTWTELSAPTTYRERNLILDDLKLDEHVRFSRLNLDASRLNAGILALDVEVLLFGGQLSLSGKIQDLNASNDAHLMLRVISISLEDAADYFGAAGKFGGRLERAIAEMDGPLAKPGDWSLAADVAAGPFVSGQFSANDFNLKTNLKKGAGKVELTAALTANNHVALRAEVKLADTFDTLVESTATGTATVDAADLAELKIGKLEMTSGRLKLNAPFTLHDRTLAASVSARVEEAVSLAWSAARAAAEIEITKTLQPKSENAEVYRGLTYSGRMTGSEVRATDFVADGMTLEIIGAEDVVHIKKMTLSRADNTLLAEGRFRIPRAGEKFGSTDAKLDLTIRAPELHAFVAEATTVALDGNLTADVTLSRENGALVGSISAASDRLTYNGLVASRFVVDGSVAENQLTVNSFELRLDELNFATASGAIGLEKPHAYAIDVDAKFADLGVFDPLFKPLAEPPGLAGSLDAKIHAAGEITSVRHEGLVDVRVLDARYRDVRDVNATIVGTVSPEVIELPGISVSSSLGSVKGNIVLRDRQLSITDLDLTAPGAAHIQGFISIPMDLEKAGDLPKMLPPDGPVNADLQLQEIELGPLLKKPDKDPSVTGTITASLKANGTLKDPNASLNLSGTGLKFAATPDLDPATLTAKTTLGGGRLELDATFAVPGIQPLTARGKLPFVIPEILEKRKIDDQSPISLVVTLPSSDASLFARATPAIRYAEGTFSIDAKAEGTISKPQLSGSVKADLPAMRFKSESTPGIANFSARMEFAENLLTISKFSGLLAGGPFGVSGVVKFDPLTNPVISLRVATSNALVARNETLTVRANSNLTIIGPMDGATVQGNVALTNSRFFREVDILPIGLPGRPAPKPPEKAPGFALEKPPFKNWKFDVKIDTADPFLVRGNLADGSIIVDAKLIGTGESPALDGSVRIDNFTASLPFSRLKVDSGYAYFSPDNPFVPVLDIQGSSQMRNYRIFVYIYGSALNPSTLFTSEPPLPQEDIISLLATGTTTSELTGNSDALAGRAAVLAVQKISRSIFKNKKPDPSEEDSFLDRFDVNVGSVDSKTGRQELETRFRLTDQFYIVGDLDIQGDVRGQLQYLIRFR